jgi:hypothetical protein
MKNRFLHCVLATLLGLVLALAVIGLGAAARAWPASAVRYVATTGTDAANDCTSKTEPCATIQHAVDVAVPGDEIHIAGGTYSRVGTLAVITKTLWMWGCYDPAFTAPDPDLYQTVLDARWGGSVISITSAEEVGLVHLTLTHGNGSGSCGSYGCGGGLYAVDTALHVGHSVITDNVANPAGRGYGGGVYVERNRQVDIWESRIVSNTANANAASSEHSEGGGIYVNGGTASLIQNQVLNNVAHVWQAGFGGGIYMNGVTQADVLTNVIRGNKANGANSPYGSYGGGLYVSNGSAVAVTGNQIEDNLTNGTGGGVEIAYSDAHLARNTIVGNVAAGGGGVFVQSTTPVTLSNNLIARNYAGFRCGGVYASLTSLPGSQVVLVNNTIADNGDMGVADWTYAVLTMTNNLIAGHATGIGIKDTGHSSVSADHNLFWNTSDPITGTHAIRQDPLLAQNYHLRPGSPAVDQGVTIPWLTTDLEGHPRPQGSQYDVGAFEGEEVWWDVFLPLALRN